MYLRLLELKGFKSFAENTEIQFQPGLNIVVGPNGCGKSNIVDAIRWVLGESNVRNLRGQRGEDVIFTGTDKKRPLGLASVSMTIDNEDRVLSTDFAEVTVNRRFYRSGESEFYINKNEVRLKDIHTLFAGTGLGKKGYSIIGQGELEQILNAKPYERRLILEEAAGLVVYRQKKEEAESKLETTAQDLLRVKDILAELENRLADLKERAGRARQYLIFSDELNGLDRRVMAYDIFIHHEETAARQQDIQEIDEQLREIKNQSEQQEKNYHEIQEELAKIQREIDELKEKKYQLGTEISTRENESKLVAERISNARERLQQLANDVTKYTGMLDKIEEDLRLSGGNLSVKETELEQKVVEADKLAEEIKQIDTDLQSKEQRFEKMKNEIIDYLNRESSIKNKITEREERSRRHHEKMARGHNEIKFRQEKIAGVEESLLVLKRDISMEQKALEELKERKQDAEQESGRVEKTISQNESGLADLEKTSRQLKNQILTLEEAMKSHIGYSEGVRRLLTAASQDKQMLPGLLGVVTDLMDVPAGMEIAIEAAIGRGVENIVVKTDKDAKQAIDLLKAKSWGRVTFLPLSILRPLRADGKQLDEAKKMPGVLGLGSDLVGYDPAYRKAFEHLLGRVLIVENMEAGLQVFRKVGAFKIVTLEGDIINPSGAMTGGRTQNRGPSPLQRRTEHREKVKELEQNSLSLAKIAKELDDSRRDLKEVKETLAALQQQISERDFRCEMLVKEIQRSTQEIKQLEDEIERLTAEEKIAQMEIQSINTELEGLRSQLDDLKGLAEKTTDDLEESKAEIEQLGRHRDILKERYVHCRDLVETKKKELEGQRNNVQQLESVKNSYSNTLADCDAQISRLNSTMQIESERTRELQSNRVEMGREMDRVQGLLKVLDRKQLTITNQAETAQQGLIPLREQAVLLEERIRNLELRKVRAETEEKNALLNWEEKFSGQEYQSCWTGMDARQQREMRKRSEVLRQEIEALGPVDIGSIAELEEVQKRHEFLKTQLDDLVHARQSLHKIIEETETQMNNRFRDFLVLANASFQRTFTDIFRGGEAELYQEPADNPWQAGVEILVKMPGKRRQVLNLLSGGERALTCIAFIFALLVLKPAPFCLLDEIDSALDEVNLMRFANYLKRLSDKMQFIVITHRQGTIEAGETIYGVTMPEQGISNVLSVTVKEAESMAG